MPTLEFKGKQHIYAHHLTVPFRPLVANRGKSRPGIRGGFSPDSPADTQKNGCSNFVSDDSLIIHGDNLHALKALLPRYAGRVKCIYIDPPYNTGNEGWRYNDKVNSPLMRVWVKDNKPVDDEDLERHDKWLCMMWPRLHLLRELLSDDGAIFVSIDDNEQQHLRMLMDEVFGAENLVANFPWQSRQSVSNDIDISVQHEYVVAYARNRRRSNRRLRQSNLDSWYSEPSFAAYPKPLDPEGYSNPDQDPRGPWKLDPFDAPHVSESLTYPIINPDTGEEHWPPTGRQWRMLQENYQRMADDGRIVFGRSGNARPQLKAFYEERKLFGQTRTSWWSGNEYGTTTEGTRTLMEIFDGMSPFEYPKPVSLVHHILQTATGPNDIVLDSFAGSGTTAHAVLALNKEDGGNRKFILVECEDYADTITAERVRRVINGVPNARDKTLQAGLGGSFTYCALGEPIDPEGMLTGENLPPWSALAAYLLHTASGLAAAGELTPQDDNGLFYETDTAAYYLLYQPEIEWLRSTAAVLTEEQAKAIQGRGKKAYVFAADKYIGQRVLTDLNITFCQIPYELHRRGWQ